MTTGNVPRAWLLGCLPVVLAACDSAPDSALTARSDSAGIPIVTVLAPQWGPDEGWTISEEPLVEIGAVTGDAEFLLNGVVGAVRLSNGDIVLGEWSTGELRRYDPEGTFVSRAAGQGEGPGEHQLLRFVGSLPGDTVVTYDGRVRRVQIFGPDGGLVGAFGVEAPWSGFPPVDVIGASERHLAGIRRRTTRASTGQLWDGGGFRDRRRLHPRRLARRTGCGIRADVWAGEVAG